MKQPASSRPHRPIDFTVEVFVVVHDRVLLRRHEKYGIWLSVGGHIEPDEDPNQAAVREVREEAGLDVVLEGSLPTTCGDDHHELVPPRFLNRHRIADDHEHVTLVYFATAASDRLGGEAVAEGGPECRWFTRDDVATSSDLAPWLKTYALAALDALSGS